MGFWDTVTELYETSLPWSTVAAEEPEQKDDDEAKDESEDKPEKEDDDEPAEEEEEEEEDEPVDPKEQLEEDCKESKACSPYKHHFDECVERVTGAHEEKASKGHPNEDCVEEFFHLAHCATACAAPKLWAALK